MTITSQRLIPQINATADPGVGDDIADGIQIGQQWFNTSNKKLFKCDDNATGAAVWTQFSTGGGSGTVTSVALTAPSIFSLTGSPITAAGTLALALAVQSMNLVLAGPTTGVDAIPTFRSMVAADIPALAASKITSGVLGTARLGTGTQDATTYLRGDGTWQVVAGGSGGIGSVTSVDLTVPSILAVSGNPITTAGTLAVTLAVQNANKLFSGPTTGADAAPTFRALVAADLGSSGTPSTTTYLRGDLTWGTPAGTGGSGTVTSVAMTVPSILSVSGSPITTSGTLAVTLANQTANQVFAGATSGGAATPAFRALVAADIPSHSASLITSGTVATARLGTGTADSTTFLRGDQTWAVPSGGGLSATAAISITVTDSTTSTVTDMFTINHRGGTPASGFGSGNLWTLETSTTNDVNAYRIDVKWDTATHASRRSHVIHSIYDTSARAVLDLSTDGTNGYVAFLDTLEASAPSIAAVVASGGFGVVKRSYLGTIATTFKGNVIAGVQDGTAAVAGQVGEVMSATQAATATVDSTWISLTSVTLTRGQWDLSAFIDVQNNGAAYSATTGNCVKFCISTAVDSNTGAIDGKTAGAILVAKAGVSDSGSEQSSSINPYSVNISASTTYYLSTYTAYNTGIGGPNIGGTIRAVRTR